MLLMLMNLYDHMDLLGFASEKKEHKKITSTRTKLTEQTLLQGVKKNFNVYISALSALIGLLKT